MRRSTVLSLPFELVFPGALKWLVYWCRQFEKRRRIFWQKNKFNSLRRT
jgi:hypothetical protein